MSANVEIPSSDALQRLATDQLPLLDFDLDSIEQKLVNAALSASDELSLGRGVAATLLMQARLFQILPSLARAERARQLTCAIANGLSRCNLPFGLWSGLTGVLYALEYTRSVCPDLLGDYAEPVAELVADTDHMLEQFLQHRFSTQHFDLVSGLTGIGAYALMRTDHTAAKRLFTVVERALQVLADKLPEGYAWRTRQAHVPLNGDRQRMRERYDLGVAHGTPGVAGMLGHAIRLGVGTEQTPYLLEETMRWLRRQEQDDLGYSAFQAMVSQVAPPFKPRWTRMAWCYGDLGLAAMVAVHAPSCSSDTMNWWQRLVVRRIAQPQETFGLDSYGLCHGVAGVLHLLRGLLAQNWDCVAAAGLAEQMERVLLSRVVTGNRTADHGLLEGESGCLLVLVESLTGLREKSRPWNLCLLTPA